MPLGDFSSLLSTGADILTDPALPTVVGQLKELASIEGDGKSTSSGGPSGKGIGLSHAVAPLNIYIFYRKHPWLIWVVGAGVIAIPTLVGIGIGRHVEKKRR